MTKNFCNLCPRKCSVNRDENGIGFCKADARIKIGRAALHHWEEPSISGERGSGTVFFSGCNLGCVYCQNRAISAENAGRYVSEEELAEIFLSLQAEGAHNINLVTPTHFSKWIKRSVLLAKERGLNIPIVYNCGGYESVDALRELEGVIDIYMPDFKYFDDKYALRYSNAPNYFFVASGAISEMFRQVGKNVFLSDGMMRRGVIVRHMMLPGLLFDSKKIIDYLYSEYGDDIYLSIMSQYTPLSWVEKYPEINKKISPEYYQSLVDYAVSLGVKNAYTQDGEAASESFIPEFYKE